MGKKCKPNQKTVRVILRKRLKSEEAKILTVTMKDNFHCAFKLIHQHYEVNNEIIPDWKKSFAETLHKFSDNAYSPKKKKNVHLKP